MQTRAFKCILGAVVADAATQPLHWIYDAEKLRTIVSSASMQPEFYSPPQNPFYSIPVGSNTCYGDQIMALLESLAESKGWNPNDYIKRLVAVFGPGTPYEQGMSGRNQLPIKNPWRNKALTLFVDSVLAGKTYPNTGTEDDEQVDSIVKIIPLVALFAGNDLLINYVEDVVRITQNNSTAVGFAIAAALILEGCILGSTAQQAVEKTLKTFRDPNWKQRSMVEDAPFIAGKLEETLRLSSKPHAEVVQKLGKS